MQDILNRTIRALRIGADAQSIYDMLKGEGLSDYSAWLTYKGAQLIVKTNT